MEIVSLSMKAAPFSMLVNSQEQLRHTFLDKTKADISRILTTYFLSKVELLYNKLPKLWYLKYIFTIPYTVLYSDVFV